MNIGYFNSINKQALNIPYDQQEEERRKARLQALQSIGSIGGGGGWLGGSMSGIGTGASIGNAIAPGLGTAIGAGLGALVGGIGSGIQGGKEEERQREMLDLQKRGLDLEEKTANFNQLNNERRSGIEGLSFLANMRSNAIQRRNRSLFANDLMRVLG